MSYRRFALSLIPAGALAGLDADGKKAVNTRNATFGVRWMYSYATANKIPMDDIIEIPVVRWC